MAVVSELIWSAGAPSPIPMRFKEGDRVWHPFYGLVTVRAYREDWIVVITITTARLENVKEAHLFETAPTFFGIRALKRKNYERG